MRVSADKTGTKGQPRSGETRICPVCGQRYYVQGYEIRRGAGKTCSRECSDKVRRAATIIEKTCPTCKKAFEVRLVDKGRVYCSPECRAGGGAGRKAWETRRRRAAETPPPPSERSWFVPLDALCPDTAGLAVVYD